MCSNGLCPQHHEDTPSSAAAVRAAPPINLAALISTAKAAGLIAPVPSYGGGHIPGTPLAA